MDSWQRYSDLLNISPGGIIAKGGHIYSNDDVIIIPVRYQFFWFETISNRLGHTCPANSDNPLCCPDK